jgi:DNA (cytosine-5)-methyltransferase 1
MNRIHLDLFTGIGGFHMAAQWAGFETIGFSEIDPYCCNLLADKWPMIMNYGDLRTACFTELEGRITVLSAGVPCQPASLAGKRRGAGDDRWLWPATLDVVELLKPTWCLLENPDGILSLGEFAGVLARLGSLGYEVRAFRVPASALGAGHQRYRVFIIAANAHRAERRTGESEGYLSNGQEAGWDQGPNGSGACDQTGIVANATSARCGEGRPEEGRQIRNETRRTQSDGRSNVERHAFGSGLEERQSFEEHCRAQFPSTQRTSLKQHCLRGFWYAESPLCRGIPRIPDRSHRLKALGNSVVPQQTYPFFAAIAQVELALTATQ